MIAIMNEKNAFLNFHSYTTCAYAVNDEKYTARTVDPPAQMKEFKKPTKGLNMFLDVRILILSNK